MLAVSFFLKIGIPENIENETMDEFSDGGLPIHLAAMHGSAKALKLFVLYGQIINSQKNLSLDTPLHLACRFKAKDCVKLLLEAGANRTLENVNGQTAEQITKDEDIKKFFE